jgi:hypothetical protein
MTVAMQEWLNSCLQWGTLSQPLGILGDPLYGVRVRQEFTAYGIDPDFADPADHARPLTPDPEP